MCKGKGHPVICHSSTE